MAETVGSAVVQEIVSGAFLLMRNNHEEMATQCRLLERLKMAHLELKFALERSSRMPITDVSLLQQRMMIKHAFEECRDVLRVNLEDEGAEQRVPLSPSLSERIMHVVKPFFNAGKGSISGSCVRRFEWFAEKADKFVRDVESGCSLARYRFSSPLITQLLEGKYLSYRLANRSQTRRLLILSSCLEDYGAVAYLTFEFKDVATPMKCFCLNLMLRLSESTDIVGVSIKCLQSLEPQFKPVADAASGELAQISTGVVFSRPEPALRERVVNLATNATRLFREEPLCCIADGFQPSAKNILSSELTRRFPEQVSLLWFRCLISAPEYNLQSSTVETNRNTIKAGPILQLSATFAPHSLVIDNEKVRSYSRTSQGEICGPFDCLDVSKMAEIVPLQAVDCFKFEPERTKYTMYWRSVHGLETFTVSKPTTEEIGCAPTKTRRLSKRKRIRD